MSERPLLLSGRLARAVADGLKTQTRRLIRPQPERADFAAHLQDQNGELAWSWCTGDKQDVDTWETGHPNKDFPVPVRAAGGFALGPRDVLRRRPPLHQWAAPERAAR